MKSRLLLLVSVVLLVFLATSCKKEDPVVSFDENLIIGKWKTPSEHDQNEFLYYRYDADKNGATWDAGENITEVEAQTFTWSLDVDQLMQIHFGGKTPKVYTVTVLTATRLEYKDDYKSYSFTKE